MMLLALLMKLLMILLLRLGLSVRTVAPIGHCLCKTPCSSLEALTKSIVVAYSAPTLGILPEIILIMLALFEVVWYV